MKRAVGYITYVLTIIVLLYLGSKYAKYLEQIGNRTYDLRPRLAFIYVFNILMGLVLAIPQFVLNVRKTGSWKVDGLKLIIVGLPTLFISSAYQLYFSVIGKYVYPVVFPLMSPEPITIAGIMFGYTLLTSVRKSDTSHNTAPSS